MTAPAGLPARTRAAIAVFRDAYGRDPQGVWAAPGRVNLIGEHTDYNGGFALPLALPQCCVAAAAPASAGVSTVRSVQRPGEVARFAGAEVAPGDVTGWAAYAAAMWWALRADGVAVAELDVLVDSDVPLGAGLSSSAAIECAVGLALAELSGAGVGREVLAAAAQRAENEFVGAPTGGMDQLAAVHGRADHTLLLDLREGTVEPVPLDLERHGLALLVVDTGVAHALVDSAYAERRAECAEAARRLGVAALRDVTPAALDAAAGLLPERLARRARHVVTENSRVLGVVALLRAGADPRAAGPALVASHRSLRDDFEVSCPELDLVVEGALGARAHGARMTGGGFGGCAVALVDADRAGPVAAAIAEAFAGRNHRPPSWFVARPSDGASRLA